MFFLIFKLSVTEYLFDIETTSMICVDNLFIDFSIVDFVSFLPISAVPKFIARDVAIMNGILLIYMMSMAMEMSPCSVSNPLGRLLSESSITFFGFFHVVFPFRLTRLGPSMSSV